MYWLKFLPKGSLCMNSIGQSKRHGHAWHLQAGKAKSLHFQKARARDSCWAVPTVGKGGPTREPWRSNSWWFFFFLNWVVDVNKNQMDTQIRFLGFVEFKWFWNGQTGLYYSVPFLAEAVLFGRSCFVWYEPFLRCGFCIFPHRLCHYFLDSRILGYSLRRSQITKAMLIDLDGFFGSTPRRRHPLLHSLPMWVTCPLSALCHPWDSGSVFAHPGPPGNAWTF